VCVCVYTGDLPSALICMSRRYAILRNVFEV